MKTEEHTKEAYKSSDQYDRKFFLTTDWDFTRSTVVFSKLNPGERKPTVIYSVSTLHEEGSRPAHMHPSETVTTRTTNATAMPKATGKRKRY